MLQMLLISCSAVFDVLLCFFKPCSKRVETVFLVEVTWLIRWKHGGFFRSFHFFVALTLHFSQILRVVVYCYFLDGDRIFRIEKLWNRLTTGVDK